uniref:Endonuclease-reverse transcriptase n=1 Tax=Haemonchus contortus TaxID=6289 RepID=A0A7I4YZD8_HAECO
MRMELDAALLKMEEILTTFYSALLRSDLPVAKKERSVLEGKLPFLSSKVRHAIETMPRAKTPGKDGISVELLQACGPPLYRALARRYTRYMAECTVPTAWKQSSTLLLFKKGDKEDLAHHRPITLLPALYKISTRCILARILRTLEEA